MVLTIFQIHSKVSHTGGKLISSGRIRFVAASLEQSWLTYVVVVAVSDGYDLQNDAGCDWALGQRGHRRGHGRVIFWLWYCYGYVKMVILSGQWTVIVRLEANREACVSVPVPDLGAQKNGKIWCGYKKGKRGSSTQHPCPHNGSAFGR